MGSKVKWVSKKDNFPKMEAAIKNLNGREVRVGIFGGRQAWLAGIHEYGCTIPVTDKMRAFLHHNGIHLKKSTTVIEIPERSFLRAGFDAHHEKVLKKVDALLPKVLDGDMEAFQMLQAIGILLSSKIKEYAVNLKSPANSELTIKGSGSVGGKGSSNPLVDTGDMVNAITWEWT